MFTSNTDLEWERYGAKDPYFGVVTQDQYRKENLTEDAKAEFFRTGEQYVDDLFRTIQAQVAPGFAPASVLDFGCGVGRILIPLAQRAKSAVGIDVSPSMLAETRRNCEARQINNVRLLQSDDELTQLKEQDRFDMIHSIIVFQHIPVRRGEAIFERLLSFLKPGGVGVLHFTYAKENTEHIRRSTWRFWIKKYVPLMKNVINWVKRGDFFAPEMEMNLYSLNKLVWAIQRQQVSRLYADFTDHGGMLGVVLQFQKPLHEPERKTTRSAPAL